MPTAPRGHSDRTVPPRGRIVRAAVAMSAAVVVGVGAAPLAHAATSAPSVDVSTVTTPADITDPDAETAALELLKATYFDDVDTKNWAALRQLFAPGAVVDTTGSFGPLFPNRDSFMAFTALTLSAINTRHQGYDPQIDLTSDTTASAVWTMQDRLSLAGLVTIHGFGHYTDQYEQVDGQWRVTYSKLTRTGFTVEFPALQAFATGLSNAYRSGGPVAALLYIVPGIIDIPVSAVKALAGAIASNFGGPPAKAEPITVPPGSTGVTTEPPGVTEAAATSPVVSSKTAVTAPAAAPTKKTAAVAVAPRASDASGSAREHTTSPETVEQTVAAEDDSQTSGIDTDADHTSGSSRTTDHVAVTDSVSKKSDNDQEPGSIAPATQQEPSKSESASHRDANASGTSVKADAREGADKGKSGSH